MNAGIRIALLARAPQQVALERALLEGGFEVLAIDADSLAGAREADAVLVHVADPPGEAQELVAELLRASPGRPLALAAESCTPELFRVALRLGAIDVLDLRQATWPAALGASLAVAQTRERGQVVALLSLKGGLGQTSLAVQLAERLHAREGKRVVLVDLCLTLGGVADWLDKPCEVTPFELARDVSRLDAELLFASLTRHPAGFHLTTTSEGVRDPAALDPGALRALLATLRRHFDWVLVDLPHDLSLLTRGVLDVCDRVIVPCAAELGALRSARGLLDALLELGVAPDRIALVEIGRRREDDLGPEDLARALGRPLTASLPEARELNREALHGSRLPSQLDPRGDYVRAVGALAAELGGQPRPSERESTAKRLLARARRLLERGGGR
jgi:pilus assembly protein CpaE